MIIVVVDSSFGHKSNQQQNATSASLQACASSAGLRGTVVPVWDDGFGWLNFLAPNEWLPFFRSIDLGFVAANINRELTCG